MHAYLDYRCKQEQIVDHLLDICGKDFDLHEFVKIQAKDALQSRLNEAGMPMPGAAQNSVQDLSNGLLNMPLTPGILAGATQDINVVQPVLPSTALQELDRLWAPNRSDEVTTEVSSPGPLCDSKQECESQTSSEDAPPSALSLLERLMSDDGDKTAPSPMEVFYRIKGSTKDAQAKNQQLDMAVENGKADAPKTTVLLRLRTEDVGQTTPSEVLEKLSYAFGIAGGRDLDFFYCPTDFQKKSVKGYAIINFRSAVAAESMVASCADCSWARHQGLAVNASRFLKQHGHVRNQKFRPVVWPCENDVWPTVLDNDAWARLELKKSAGK
jgi:hypothetical protein